MFEHLKQIHHSSSDLLLKWNFSLPFSDKAADSEAFWISLL